MYGDYANENRAGYYYAITMMFITIGCVMVSELTRIANGANDLHILDNFTMYYIIISTSNAIMCIPIGSHPRVKAAITAFMTLIVPLIHLMSEKTKLIGEDVACLIVIAVNFFFFLYCIDEWYDNTVDEVMKKLNGSDLYFVKIRGEILKRCEDDDLYWGVRNLSIIKLFKLARKGLILDKEEKKEKEKEERRRMSEEKDDENRKISFLNTIDL